MKRGAPSTIRYTCPACRKPHFTPTESAGQILLTNCRHHIRVVPVLLPHTPDKRWLICGQRHRVYRSAGWVEDVERGLLISKDDWPARWARLKDMQDLIG